MRRLFAAAIFAVCMSAEANASCADWFITPQCGEAGLAIAKQRRSESGATDFSASRRRTAGLSGEFTGDRYSGGAMAAPQAYVVRKGKRSYRAAARTINGYARHLSQHATRDLSGFPEPLIQKVREIESACGSTVISAFRPGARIAGTNHMSLHSVKRAVDMQGNSSCMYAHLSNWPGGYSTDYGRMQHIHISYSPSGQEWGSRFAHGGGKSRVRYAKRRHRQHYATAGAG